MSHNENVIELGFESKANLRIYALNHYPILPLRIQVKNVYDWFKISQHYILLKNILKVWSRKSGNAGSLETLISLYNRLNFSRFRTTREESITSPFEDTSTNWSPSKVFLAEQLQGTLNCYSISFCNPILLLSKVVNDCSNVWFTCYLENWSL